MAGDTSKIMTWHLSGGTSNNSSDASLGGGRSNFQCRHGAVTATAAAAVGDTRVYCSTVYSFCIDSFAYFRDGASGGWGALITNYDIGGGWIDLLDPLPTTVGIGDEIWFYNKGYGPMPYGPTLAIESALGMTQYIGLYTTKPGASLTDFRWWIDDQNPGNVEHWIAASNDNSFTLPTIPNKETEPDLSGMLFGGGSGRWTQARSFESGWPIFNYSSGVIGFWLKRVVPANALRQTSQFVSIVGETPGGFSSRLVIVWNTEGFTPVLTVTHAPTIYIRGGARFKATVIGQETGLRVSGVPVGFAQTAGPGTLTLPAAPAETDENGELLASYAAPVDVGEIGQTVTVEAQV